MQLGSIHKNSLILGGGGRRPKPSQLTVNSWVGSKKELKAELRVQGTPMHITAMLTCKGSGTALLWRWQIRSASSESGVDYPACEPHKSHFSPMVENHEKLRNGLCCTLAFSKCLLSSTWEMPKPDKRNPGSPEMPRHGPDRNGAAEKPLRVLRVPE